MEKYEHELKPCSVPLFYLNSISELVDIFSRVFVLKRREEFLKKVHEIQRNYRNSNFPKVQKFFILRP